MLKWINDKYRLVLMNDQTFQEERSFRLHPSSVALITLLVFLLVSGFTLLLLVATPLGRIVPEKSNQDIRSQITTMYLHVDSLENAVNERDAFILRVKELVYEQFEYEGDLEDPNLKKTALNVEVPEKSDELRQLLESVDSEAELGNLLENTLTADNSISNMIFLTPIKGMVSDTFAPTRAHYGTDIVAPKGSIIRATQAGTVLVATWSADTGHMLAIQHANNVVSFYKHNASLLKKTGDMVGAGEGIAIIGNTGEMTEGPHLHFELWFNGQAINPERYIEFKN
jgi:murein DD-endopeptidase MepM/ murein hydrolase activator NlpD